MASAMYPSDETQLPPAYEFENKADVKIPYQQHTPSSAGYPNYVASPPPPTPFYIQSTFNPVIGAPYLGQNPTPIQCPRCHQQVITMVQYESGAGTWLISLAICFFGGALGCCLIPFCIPACQDAVHSCPACRNIIGRRNVF